MKIENTYLLTFATALSLLGTSALSQEEIKEADSPASNTMSIPFSNDGDRFLEVNLLNGGITVIGYEGDEVKVVAENAEFKKDKEKDVKDGLRLIGGSSPGLFAEEANNTIKIGSNNMGKKINLKLEVPLNTTIKLSCVNNGDIFVQRMSGEMDINNLNGDITITESSGVILAHALNGDITAKLIAVPIEKPMSFTGLNGDIDVSMPANTKADLKMQTFQGDIRSNFDIEMLPSKAEAKITDNREHGGRYRQEFESAVFGKINGGGPQFVFNTHNGDIRIRKIEEAE